MESKYPPDKRNYTLPRGDPHDWPAVAKLAAKIRTAGEEKASAHLALWERLGKLCAGTWFSVCAGSTVKQRHFWRIMLETGLVPRENQVRSSWLLLTLRVF